jgi:NADPH:quinone reductase
MTLTARINRIGGPEVIEWTDIELPPPGQGEVRMRNTAVGLNFIDTYHRSGLYPVPLPNGLGLEAAGVVEAVGEGVSGLAVGDRVCTFGPALGAYSEARNIAALALFKTPDGVSDEVAAAALLKACTAEFLVERCARVEAGWPVLVHAAAGGVGLLLVQWLKHIGARVIGTVSTAEKAQLARQAGADLVLLSTDGSDIAAEAKTFSGGKGVRVVFDGIGQDSWDLSLDCLAPRGLMVSYGNASGPVAGVNLATISAKGSLFVTRPGLFHYYVEPAEREAGAARVFEMLRSGAIVVSINQRYALKDAAQAHIDIEARKTSGSTLLIPQGE